jgi:exodeoxyribonuclease VII small subunit
MSKTNTPSVENLNYEQAFAELETIVQQLEEDSASLQETLTLFERGQALAAYCTQMLEQAELKVETLSLRPGDHQ